MIAGASVAWAAGELPIATLCPAADIETVGAQQLRCATLSVPGIQVERLIWGRMSLRNTDGLDEYLMGTAWPVDFGSQRVPARRAEYVLAVWSDVSGQRVAAYPVMPAAREAMLKRARTGAVPFVDTEVARRSFLRRIALAGARAHVRRYLGGHVRIGGFDVGGAMFEITMLENESGLDLLCLANQALIAPRRWWLIPAHVLPTDDARSQGFIGYDDPAAKEPRVIEIRFPLKKAVPVE